MYARGWLNYYGIASMKNNIDDINGWLYHRIRMCIWKQWKKPRTKARNLIKMGVPEDLAMQAGNTRRGHWFATHTVAINMAMTKERLINSGFNDLATGYQSVHVNYWNRRVPNGTHGGVRGRRLVTASYSIMKNDSVIFYLWCFSNQVNSVFQLRICAWVLCLRLKICTW